MEVAMAGGPKQAKDKSDPASALEDHEARISVLEKHIVALTAPVQTVDLEFDLDKSTNAHLARCYLEGTTKPSDDLANNMGIPHGVLRKQQVGSKITVVVQASDTEPSNVGVFTITHSDRPKISGDSDSGTTNFDLVVTA
jgi:hypothetical protein